MSGTTIQGSERKVIILGTGLYGLSAAKAYLQIRPDIDLTLIDADDSIGGVWSASRVYDGLVADLPCPTFEWSDMQMIEELNIPKWGDITGRQMNEYIERYVKKFDLKRRCVLNTEVSHVERNGKGWKLFTRSAGKEDVFSCDTLIVATGQNSQPNVPDIDTSKYEGLVIHAKDRHKRSAEILSDDIKAVVVMGGNKSAVEAAGSAAMAGKTVHWLIREDGAGPGMLVNPRMASGRSGPEIALCRVMDFQSPTIYGYRGWWDSFFLSGKSYLGLKLFNWFWDTLTESGLGDRYDRSENGRLLGPEIRNVFWSPTGISVAHDNEYMFFEIINEGKLVHVARASITSMSGKTISLSNGKKFSADAVILCTGWQPALPPLFSDDLKIELGLPVPKDRFPRSETEYWTRLDEEAEKKVLDMYPVLATPPKNAIDRKHTSTPYRCLHGIVPPRLAAEGDRSLVFLGQVSNTQNGFFSEISSVWAVAYLEGMVRIDTKEEVDRQIALANAFMRKRYPGRKNIPYAVLEIRDWMDVMLKDLGVRTDRGRLHYERSEDKGFGWWGWKAWWQEWFVAYEPVKYKGIVEEAIAAHATSRGESRKSI